jgi:hypothetical protein
MTHLFQLPVLVQIHLSSTASKKPKQLFFKDTMTPQYLFTLEQTTKTEFKSLVWSAHDDWSASSEARAADWSAHAVRRRGSHQRGRMERELFARNATRGN